MRKILVSALILVLRSLSPATAAPNLFFQNYSSDSGLPNRSICTFAQDRNGVLWVGTNEGICLFDGESFITPGFLTEEPFLSSSGRVFCIDTRNVLWLVSGDGVVSYSLDTGESQLYKEYRASRIVCDGEGVVWLRTPQGLVSYDPVTDSWDNSFTIDFVPINISISISGELCATARDGCVYVKKKGEARFKSFWVLSDSSMKAGLSLAEIAACDENRLIYSTTDNSVYLLDIQTGKSRKVFDGHIDGKDAILMDILARDPRHIWLATDNGLFIYDDNEGRSTEYLNQIGNPYSLASSKLRCLFKDREDRIWLGSFYDGASRLIDTGGDIRIFRVLPEDSEHSLSGKTVSSVCAGADGIIWAATEDGFLEKIYPDGQVRPFGFRPGTNTRRNTYQAIAYSEGRVYAVDLGEGLSVYDAESLKLIKRYDVGDNYCNDLLFTSRKEMLVGTSDGLHRLDRDSDSFVRVESIPAGFVSALCEDWKGNIWLSARHRNIYIVSPQDFSAKMLEITDGTKLDRLVVSDIYEDKDGRMLMATNGNGLLFINPDRNKPWQASCSVLARQDGLPSNICCAVTQDKAGRLWVSTMNGIVSIEEDVVSNINGYGLIGDCFSPGSVLNAPDDLLYFGSSDGMIAFNPLAMPERAHSLFLADVIKTKDHSFSSVSEHGHSPFTSESIRIPSDEASALIFSLICLRSDFTEVVRYSYSLTGNGRDIISTSEEKQITYANLTPGKYTFTANVIGDDSPGARVSLDVIIVPPFYMSLPAKLFYILLAIGILCFIQHLRHTWIRKDKERAMERLEACRQKEVYESKINFFTNISHEIRTPLTLIKVPLDKIMSAKAYLPESEYDMKCIQDSTDRLLGITDQILDFRKMENGSAKLSFSLTDLTKLVADACSCMESLANECSVTLSSELPGEPVQIMCAPGSIDKIISNLLMNGIKYCSSAVTLRLETISGGNIRISVISDGAPIAQEEREKIFEPFYQSDRTHSKLSANEGTGLGLSLARSLASLHNGTLTLDPDYTDGNCFILVLPTGDTDTKDDVEEEENYLQGDEMDSSKYSILIVEDDTTLNDYIKTELSSEYTVYQAYNGSQALSVLTEKNISLIVSDIMMPEMDGCELVDVVKNTLKFSHVPIILLTAVTDYNTQLDSLHSGADGYITKPFSMQILRATIFNTLRNREILYERFSTMPFTRPENMGSSQDDEFMKRLYDYVLENISNQDLSVLDLADKMNTSRSTLYRKIRTNTGLNINEYIRVCRLKKAAELLSTQKYQTKEVAYMVGFSNLPYFTKAFQKQFNMSPSSLIKKK